MNVNKHFVRLGIKSSLVEITEKKLIEDDLR